MGYAESQICSIEAYELYPAKPFYRARLPAISGTENYPARYFSLLHSEHLNRSAPALVAVEYMAWFAQRLESCGLVSIIEEL